MAGKSKKAWAIITLKTDSPETHEKASAIIRRAFAAAGFSSKGALELLPARELLELADGVKLDGGAVDGWERRALQAVKHGKRGRPREM